MEDQLIFQLETNLSVINGQLNNRGKEEFNFKPAHDAWSMIEVLSHLVDEEIFDFRARLFSVVDNPSNTLPAFDPVATMAAKKLIDEDYNELLDQFMDERLKSLAMLRTLEKEDWQKEYLHPEKGPLSAKFFLANWVAHDYIHIQQINRLAWQYLNFTSKINLDYAGNFRIG